MPPKNRRGPTALYRVNRLDQICRAHNIRHRLTKPNHRSTNGPVERMNRPLKDATVERYHYNNHNQPREHVGAFPDAYAFARRLDTLRGLKPHHATCRTGADDPGRFRRDPTQLTSGLNS